MKNLVIANRIISDANPCYVIAEIGNNHQGSLETCKEMFKVAKQCGADAVKLQKRNNEELFTKTQFNAPYENENSYGPTYGTHRDALEFTWEQYEELKEYAKELKITFFATAFDHTSANFLSHLDMPAYKIASGDLTNIPLIEHVAKKGKPLIISTGGASWADIDKVYLKVVGKYEFAFLHCIATYPNQAKEMNLKCIETMKVRYPGATIGFSSHHPGVYMNIVASVLGAQIIETHFTLNRASKGTDHGFSLEPKGLETLCSDLKSVRWALGHGEKTPLDEEKKAIGKMGKSVYPMRTIKKGEKLTEENIVCKSPGGGISPDDMGDVIDRVSVTGLSTGVMITKEDYGD